MTDRRVRVRPAGERLGRIFATLAVYVIQALRSQVVGFEFFVGDRPGRRNSAEVANFTEVLAPQSKQRGTIEFFVTTDVVVGVRVKRLSVLVPPLLLSLVFGFHVDRA